MLTKIATPFSSPLQWMLSVERQMDQLFGGDSGADARARLKAEEGGYSLRAELPGVPQEAVKISVEDGVLSVEAERELTAPEGYELRHRERGALSLKRRLRLPAGVDPEGIKASLKDGVLTIELPERKKAEPKQISVQIN